MANSPINNPPISSIEKKDNAPVKKEIVEPKKKMITPKDLDKDLELFRDICTKQEASVQVCNEWISFKAKNTELNSRVSATVQDNVKKSISTWLWLALAIVFIGFIVWILIKVLLPWIEGIGDIDIADLFDDIGGTDTGTGTGTGTGTDTGTTTT